MIERDIDVIARELVRAGFELGPCEHRTRNGPPRYNLSGRGPYGAFAVSAPTEAGAYRAALDQVRSHLVPADPAGRDRR